MTPRYFKILQVGTGLFSTGGCEPSWSVRGKIWTNIGHVKSHLNQVIERRSWGRPTGSVYADAVIVEFQLTPTGVPLSVPDMLKEMKAAEVKKEQAYEAARKARQEAEEKEQLRKLQQKYPNP